MQSKFISEMAISLPFSITAYGKVGDTKDRGKIWGDRVRSVVGTLVTERVMRPRFGSKIPLQMFNTQTEATDKITSEVYSAFAEHLPLLTLTSVNVQFNDVDNVITADITYSLPNDEQRTTNIGLAVVSGTTPLTEENLW